MSVEIFTLEEITVNNENARTAEFLKELIQHYSAIEYIGTYLMQIGTDTEKYALDSETSSDIDAMLNSKDTNNEFLRILKSAEKAKSFSLKIGYQGFNEPYGYAYWQDVLTPDLKDFVCCKCLEYCDCDDGIGTYVFDKTHDDLISWDATPEQVKDVEIWYSYNFGILIETEDVALDEGEIGEYLQSFGERIIEKYIDCDLDIYDGWFGLEGGASLSNEKCAAFLCELQSFADFCKEHNLSPNIICSFTAERPVGIFAAMDIVEKEGKLSIEYCRF